MTTLVSGACVPEDPPEGPRRRRGGPGAAAAAVRAPSPPASPVTRADPPVGPVFKDDFERSEIGPNYRALSGAWQLVDGQLCVEGARNRPLWLARTIPTNARIEFDVVPGSAEGDVKVEAWGDGRSGATQLSYSNATSYIVIFGGWRNTAHVLARLDEHAANRRERRVRADADDVRSAPVEAEQRYHFRIERRDARTVRWFVDGTELLHFDDPEPLRGPGHDHFAFNDWETPVCFDNLSIQSF